MNGKRNHRLRMIVSVEFCPVIWISCYFVWCRIQNRTMENVYAKYIEWQKPCIANGIHFTKTAWTQRTKNKTFAGRVFLRPHRFFWFQGISYNKKRFRYSGAIFFICFFVYNLVRYIIILLTKYFGWCILLVWLCINNTPN